MSTMYSVVLSAAGAGDGLGDSVGAGVAVGETVGEAVGEAVGDGLGDAAIGANTAVYENVYPYPWDTFAGLLVKVKLSMVTFGFGLGISNIGFPFSS